MFRGFGRRWNHTATVEPILKKSVLVETTYSHLGWLKKGAVICLGLGVALSDEGIRRSLSFWGVAFPIFLHYRFVQWKMEGKPEDEVSAAFDKLHDKYAPVAHHMCLRLRGFYLKQAQLMSTLDDFIPPAYMAWCKTTQDQVRLQAYELTNQKKGSYCFCARTSQDNSGEVFGQAFGRSVFYVERYSERICFYRPGKNFSNN